jgi:hypothetical protein
MPISESPSALRKPERHPGDVGSDDAVRKAGNDYHKAIYQSPRLLLNVVNGHAG